jgi:hypothetical protein
MAFLGIVVLLCPNEIKILIVVEIAEILNLTLVTKLTKLPFF